MTDPNRQREFIAGLDLRPRSVVLNEEWLVRVEVREPTWWGIARGYIEELVAYLALGIGIAITVATIATIGL